MDDIFPVTDVERPRERPFEPGLSGNPNGRPKGGRNKTTMAVEALLDGDAEALTRKVVETALEGHSAALRFCVARLLPARRNRPVEFELPEIAGAGDAVKVARAILATCAKGTLSPREAADVMGLLTPDPDARGRRGQADRGRKGTASMNRRRLCARPGSPMPPATPRSAPGREPSRGPAFLRLLAAQPEGGYTRLGIVAVIVLYLQREYRPASASGAHRKL